MSFWTRVKRGWQMSLISYEFIMKHKKVLLFTMAPVVFLCVTIISILGILITKTSFLNNVVAGNKDIVYFASPIPWFVTFIILFFILKVLMDVALSHYISNIFGKKEGSFLNSLGRGFSRLWTIIKWSIIDYLVGIVASNIKNQKGIIGKFIGWFLGNLISLAWAIATFFMIPIIAQEELGIIDSIKKSGNAMKKTFGQNVGATFALGIANFILFTIVSSVIWLTAFLGFYLFAPSMPYTETGALIATFTAMITFAAPFFLTLPFTIAAGTIFKTASYNFSQGKPIGPFSTQEIKDSFEDKKE